MAFAFVASNNLASNPIAYTPVAGHLIVVWAAWENSTGTTGLTSVADNLNTFTLGPATGNGNTSHQQMAYMLSATGGASGDITVTFPSGASLESLLLYDFSYAGSITLDVGDNEGTNTGNGTALTSGSVTLTTTGQSEVVFAGGNSYTAPSTFSSEQINSVAADGSIEAAANQRTVLFYRIVTAAFTGTATATCNNSDDWGCHLFAFKEAAASSAALTGTATASITEADVVTGGKTIILTLTGDTYVAAGTGPIGSIADTTALINGIDSGQAEATGWDAVVKASLITNMATAVVRTSATVCTITLTANATYNITAQETITATIPAAVLTLAAPIVASPTFTVATAAAAVAPTVNDTATLTESVAMKMHLQNMTVNDAPTVTEALTMHMRLAIRMEKLS